MAILRLAPGRAEFRKVGDEVVVLDLAQSRYLAINRTGAILWPLLEAGASEDELRDRLVTEFVVPQDVARADLAAFILDLEQRGLIERQG